MAKYLPLLVSLRGKLGALVYDKSLRVRQYVYSGTGGRLAEQCAFANLTKQWPASDIEYKQVCAAVHRHGEADGGLARQVAIVAKHALASGTLRENTRETLLADDIDEKLGKYASLWYQRNINLSLTFGGAWFRIVWTWELMPEVSELHHYAYLLMDANLAVVGHEETNMYAPWVGVVHGTWYAEQPFGGNTVLDVRYNGAAKPSGRALCMLVCWHIAETTGEIVLDGAANCSIDPYTE